MQIRLINDVAEGWGIIDRDRRQALVKCGKIGSLIHRLGRSLDFDSFRDQRFAQHGDEVLRGAADGDRVARVFAGLDLAFDRDAVGAAVALADAIALFGVLARFDLVVNRQDTPSAVAV